MSLIERAAQRLEELRKAGVVLPDEASLADDVGKDSLTNHLANPAIMRPSPGSSEHRLVAPASKTPNPAVPVREKMTFEVDIARLANLGFVTPDMPRSRIADEFRILKRPVIANASGNRTPAVKHGNLIMVTSAVPGEGKTFTAVNLAMSIAMELDRTVLLVDADVARPSLPSTLGFPNCRGLLDVLKNPSLDLGEVLIHTNIERLTLLSSGTQHDQATELLASESMNVLLKEVAERYSDRIVIFDSPPMLVTTESRVLATQMGQIIFVVHAESTLQSEVKQALATIESCPIKLLVLNQARTTAQGAYGYGYGYGA
jgi:protein-tyrosine kinase